MEEGKTLEGGSTLPEEAQTAPGAAAPAVVAGPGAGSPAVPAGQRRLGAGGSPPAAQGTPVPAAAAPGAAAGGAGAAAAAAQNKGWVPLVLNAEGKQVDAKGNVVVMERNIATVKVNQTNRTLAVFSRARVVAAERQAGAGQEPQVAGERARGRVSLAARSARCRGRRRVGAGQE